MVFFLTNGPGDPQKCQPMIDIIKKWLITTKNIKPIFGICLGHQMLSLAAGFTTSKMNTYLILILESNIGDFI